MNKLIDLSTYHAAVISDSINSIWVGEYGDKDRSEFFCTINASLQDFLNLEFDSIRIITAVDCGSRSNAIETLRNLKILGFSIIPPSEIKADTSHFIYLIAR